MSKQIALIPIDVTDKIIAGEIDYLSDITRDMNQQVKEAHVPSIEELQEHPNEDFGLVLYHPHLGEMKKLASYDPALTELNMRIFVDNFDKLPEEVIKVGSHYLYKAAKYFKLKVPKEINKYANEKLTTNRVDISQIDETKYVIKLASMSNSKVKATQYALPSLKKYALDSSELTKAAIAYFDRYYTKLPIGQRLEYAQNVKVAAAKYRVQLDGSILNKYASLETDKFNTAMAVNFGVRQSYVDEDTKLVYQELLEKSAELGPEKTVKTLEKLDKKANLAKLWNVCIEDPCNVVYANPDIKFVKLGEKIITAADLASIAKHPDALKYVDQGTADALVGPEGLEIFESLPTPIKNNLENLK